MEEIWRAGLAGLAATAFMDGVSVMRRSITGRAGLDYALVARWVGHMSKGRFVHENIMQSAPVAFERPVGWALHYVIGALLAWGLLGLAGARWIGGGQPLLVLAYGVATVVVPFLIMQPAMGLGIAASRTPAPWVARKGSVISHLAFGVGLMLAAYLV